MKHCKQCKEVKPLGMYYQTSRTKDGFMTVCKDCRNDYIKSRREKFKLRAVVVIPESKTCYKCNETKPSTDFYNSRCEIDGLSQLCKKCSKERILANPESSKKARRKCHIQSYGITEADYQAMYQKQGGKCAICEQPETKLNPKTGLIQLLCIDHCHRTDKVRALLCSECNQGLGKFKDKPDILRRAAVYLEQKTLSVTR